MIAERAFQALAQSGALRAHALEQAVAADDLLHCQRGGAGGGVAAIGVAMLEEAEPCSMARTMRSCAMTAPIGW